MLQDKMVNGVLLMMVEMVVQGDQEAVEVVEAKEMEKVELFRLMEVLVEQDLLEVEVEEAELGMFLDPVEQEVHVLLMEYLVVVVEQEGETQEITDVKELEVDL